MFEYTGEDKYLFEKSFLFHQIICIRNCAIKFPGNY